MVAGELLNALGACDVAARRRSRSTICTTRATTAPASFVDLLLQQLPPRWSVAITARHEPALRLARLRAQGELAEFREAT